MSLNKLMLLSISLTVIGCAGVSSEQSVVDADVQGERQEASSDKSYQTNEGIVLSDESSSVSETEKYQYFDGTGRFYKNTPSERSSVNRTTQGEINLQFREADIGTVLEAVLVDTLGLSYQLDPNVKAKISLETSGGVNEDGLLFVLETVLKAKKIALIKTELGYQVLPAAEAPRQSRLQRMPASEDLPGYAVQIVPLRYTSPSEMRKVLEPFAPRDGILASDDARNMLILAGTRQELASMLETIDTFDVNWLEGISFAMFDLQYVSANELAKELLQIFGDAESPIAGTVRFIPIPRLNRLLVLSPQAGYLRDVETWVRRLDLGGSAPGRRIYVYHVQNGRASDLAQSLNSILGAQSGAGDGAYRSGDNAASNSVGSELQRPSGRSAAIGGGRRSSDPRAPQEDTKSKAFGTESIRIVPSEENNSLLILATPSEFGVVEAALRQMDQAPRQVLIEASLAEISLTDELRYGVQWFFEHGDNQVTLSEVAGGGVASAFPGFSYVYSGSSDTRAVLNALEAVTDVEVISSPKLLVLNNQSATIQVGDEVPVPTQSAVSTSDSNAPIVNSVEYRDTGVILTVTPRINKGGLIYLDVSQEVSDVVETTSSGIDAPTIQQRRIESTVAVQNGETIALGGLIRETDTVSKSGVPFLQNIPALGNLFRRNSLINRRTELIILLTPRVIRDVQETRDVLDYLKKTFSNVKQAW